MERHALAELVAHAPASLVLPHRPRGAAVVVPTPFRLLDALSLSESLLLVVVEDADGHRWASPVVVEDGAIRRAVAGDGAAAAVVGLDGTSAPSGFAIKSWRTERCSQERAITVDQTNDSVIVDDRVVVKWSVRLPDEGEPGSPAATRIATLAGQGFTAMPEPWKLIGWNDGRNDVLLVTATSYLRGAEDGWDWAVREVGEYATGTSEALPLDSVIEIGRMAAGMHRALAHNGMIRATSDTGQGWKVQAQTDLADALESLDGAEFEALRRRSGRIGESFDEYDHCVDTPLIDVHGDFHIGQILRWGDGGLVVTDFDGSPVLSNSQRSSQLPAAFDIASMVASLDHVGRVVIRRVEGADAERVRMWIEHARQAFLTSYKEAMGADYERLVDEALLYPFRLQQEVREYLYAAAHLPHWRYVPDMALRDLLPDEEL